MYEPIPTEYKGRTFRSKSEAVFAFCLEHGQNMWEYEPSGFLHPWDFIVTTFRNKTYLIEYKPHIPTQTYLDNLIQKVRNEKHETLIVFGSIWVEYYAIIPVFSTLHHEYGQGNWCIAMDQNGIDVDGVLNITQEIMESAWDYRFDLA
jgi:hypothetical protein